MSILSKVVSPKRDVRPRKVIFSPPRDVAPSKAVVVSRPRDLAPLKVAILTPLSSKLHDSELPADLRRGGLRNGIVLSRTAPPRVARLKRPDVGISRQGRLADDSVPGSAGP